EDIGWRSGCGRAPATTRQRVEGDMAKFLVVARDVGNWEEMSGGQDFEAVIGRYIAWTENLAQRGRLHATEKLEDGTGRVLRGRKPKKVTDGPFVEAGEVLGGLWVIEAD